MCIRDRDDDEYWIDGYKYYNENDFNSKVSPRFGFNAYTYNLATKKGKMLYYMPTIICAVIMIPLCFNLLEMDFSHHKITISKENNSISIDYPSYDYEFSVAEIEDVSLVDEVNFKIRTNGISTDEYSRGSFKSVQYGKCKAYIYNESKPYIVVKLKNTYLIYNERKMCIRDRYKIILSLYVEIVLNFLRTIFICETCSQ